MRRAGGKELDAVGRIDPSELEGTWKLVAWVQEYDDGRRRHPFGQDAAGYITYLAGRMSALISRTGREPFVSGGQWDAEDSEKARAYGEVLAYGGTYTIAEGTVTHHVDLSLYPNWVGADQVRNVDWDGTTLNLTARLEEGGPQARTARLAWVRA